MSTANLGTLGTAVVGIHGDLSGLRRDLAAARAMAAGTVADISRLSNVVMGGGFGSVLSHQASIAGAGITNLHGLVGGLASELRQLAQRPLHIAGGILIAGGIRESIGVLREFGEAMIGTNAQMEQYRTSLGVLLGSRGAAAEMAATIERMADSTPFTAAGLTKAFTLMRSYGFEAEKILPMLTKIGNAAASSPEGMENAVQHIALAISQMKAAGRVTGQDVLQLTSAGIPFWDILSKGMRKSMAEVRQMAMHGAIDANQAIDILMQGLDERFGGMMEKQSKTFSGLTSTLNDAIAHKARDIGEPLFEALKKRMAEFVAWLSGPAATKLAAGMKETLAKLVQSADDALPRLITMAQKFGEWLTNGSAAALALQIKDVAKWVAQLAVDVGPTIVAIEMMGSTVTGLGTALTVLGAAGGPVAALTIALGTLAGAYASATLNGEKFGDHIARLSGLLPGMTTAVNVQQEQLKRSNEGQANAKLIHEGIKGGDGRLATRGMDAEKARLVALEAEIAREDKELRRERDRESGLIFEKPRKNEDWADTTMRVARDQGSLLANPFQQGWKWLTTPSAAPGTIPVLSPREQKIQALNNEADAIRRRIATQEKPTAKAVAGQNIKEQATALREGLKEIGGQIAGVRAEYLRQKEETDERIKKESAEIEARWVDRQIDASGGERERDSSLTRSAHRNPHSPFSPQRFGIENLASNLQAEILRSTQDQEEVKVQREQLETLKQIERKMGPQAVGRPEMRPLPASFGDSVVVG